MPELSGISAIGTDYTSLPEKREIKNDNFMNSIFDAFNSAISGAPASTSHVG